VLRRAGIGEESVPGRRSKAYSAQGATVRAVRGGRGINMVGTVLAAADRGARIVGDLIDFQPDDLRGSLRRGMESNLIVFLVDSSGSMAGRDRLSAVTGAVTSMLRDAYQRRDKVAVITVRGTAPEAGEDARIEKKFDMGVKGRPAARAHDRVDYKDMNIFIRAHVGDVLAVRVPETPGTPGKNVFGEEIAPKPGKPAALPQGKNTKIVNTNELVAVIDGQIVDDGKKIGVDPHLVIDSSVDVGTGNIDFAGSIEIQGDVESGFSVKAAGDVEIKGMVGGAEIEGRNVIIHGGIRGMNTGKIRAREDVSASFVENANVAAGRDIFINDVVLHSEMRAGHHVLVESRRGIITGGTVSAGESIRAKVFGNTFYVQTNLNVGIDPNLKHQHDTLLQDYQTANKQLTEIQRALEILKKQPLMSLPEKRREQLVKMTHLQFPLANKIKEMQEQLEQLNNELEEMKHGTIAASDTVYPGVNATINGVKKAIGEELHHAKLRMVDGEIVVGIL